MASDGVFRLLIEWSLVRIQPGEPVAYSLPFFCIRGSSQSPPKPLQLVHFLPTSGSRLFDAVRSHRQISWGISRGIVAPRCRCVLLIPPNWQGKMKKLQFALTAAPGKAGRHSLQIGRWRRALRAREPQRLDLLALQVHFRWQGEAPSLGAVS